MYITYFVSSTFLVKRVKNVMLDITVTLCQPSTEGESQADPCLLWNTQEKLKKRKTPSTQGLWVGKVGCRILGERAGEERKRTRVRMGGVVDLRDLVRVK